MKNRIFKRFTAGLLTAALIFSPLGSAGYIKAATDLNDLRQIRFTMPYGNGDYILTKSITGVTGISISGDVKIDLNGHKISGSSFAGPLFKVGSGHTLTITDSKGGGSIVNENNQEAVGCYGGTLNISGGTFYGVKYGVKMTGGKLNISGGTVKGDSEAIYMQKGTLNMTGGKAQTTCDTGCALYMADGNAEISGGTLSASGTYATGITMKNGSLYLKNGTLKCTEAHSYGLLAEGGEAYISGGKIKSGGTLSTGIGVRSGGLVNISGGSITSTNRGIVLTGASADSPAGLDMSKGDIKINGPYGNAIIMNKNVDVNITGGSLSTPEGYPELLTKKNTTGNIFVSKKVSKKTRMVQRYSEDDFSFFADNGTTYSRNMLITDPHDLYSAVNDASSKLNTTIEVTVDEATLAAFEHYSAEWFAGKAFDVQSEADVIYSEESSEAQDLYDEYFDSKSYTGEITEFGDITYDPAVSGNEATVATYTLTINPLYTLFYETSMLLQKKAKKKAASPDAQEYAAKISKILKTTVSGKKTDKDKIKAVHDYMVKTYSYDFAGDEDSAGFYGPLTNNLAVSTGYSELFCLFMSALGIESDTVTGYNTQNIGTRILHTWNSVTLDKTVYYVDVTWDDSTDSTDYYMKEEDAFYKDGYHVPLS
ncbi:MAG: hypothetical protein IKQ56_06880 [Lachnospiraceae bacterium]|nr:hypothetical protein [Lachnospiraceae bacterium]